jgi:hypothetical protein
LSMEKSDSATSASPRLIAADASNPSASMPPAAAQFDPDHHDRSLYCCARWSLTFCLVFEPEPEPEPAWCGGRRRAATWRF